MRKRLVSLLVGLAAVVVLVAGCGGGGSSSGAAAAGEGARLSHTEWVSRADAICSVDHEANAGREAEFEELLEGGLTTAKVRDEAAELIRGAVPSVETEVKGVSALRPASDDEAAVARVVGGLERTAALDQKFAEALERGSAHELEAVIGQVSANGTRLEALGRELGTKVCGRPHSGAGAEAISNGGDASQGEWADHANEICRRNREANASKLEEFEELVRREGLGTPQAQREGAALIRAGIANVETEIGSFKALEVPRPVEREFEKLIAKLETLVGIEGEFVELLEDGQVKALPRTIDRILKAELAVRGLSLHLGLRVCGKLLQSQGGHSLA